MDPAYVKGNYLESVARLRSLLNTVECTIPLLAAGGDRPSNRQHGAPVGPSDKGRIADSIMGLAKNTSLNIALRHTRSTIGN